MNPAVDIATKAIAVAALVVLVIFAFNKALDLSFDNGKLTATVEFKDSLRVLERGMQEETARIVKAATDERDAKIAERDTEIEGLIDERNANREASLREAIANPQTYERNFACDLERGMHVADGTLRGAGCARYGPAASSGESAGDQPR